MRLAVNASDTWTVNATIVGLYIFYNDSYFDGNNPAANAQDDNAIAPDKQALLPGQTATFSNYTSYSHGINGIMIDVLGLPTTPSASDFVLKTGNSNNPAAWGDGPAPQSITVRPGAGVGGSDRVTIIWPDYNASNNPPNPANVAVYNQWLQVTVLAAVPGGNQHLGLAASDTFYWGNQIGETGNVPGDTAVNALDTSAVINHYTGFSPAGISNPYDINRDNDVNAIDASLVINSYTGFSSLVLLSNAPSMSVLGQSSLAASPSSATILAGGGNSADNGAGKAASTAGSGAATDNGNDTNDTLGQVNNLHAAAVTAGSQSTTSSSAPVIRTTARPPPLPMTRRSVSRTWGALSYRRWLDELDLLGNGNQNSKKSDSFSNPVDAVMALR